VHTQYASFRSDLHILMMEYRTDVDVAQRQCPSRRPNARVNRPSTSSHVCMYACMHN
jgi:hypothetical protein